MADIGVDLLDTGKDFILVADDIQAVMRYGEFSLALINSDYDKMLRCTTDFIKDNHALHVAADLQQAAFKDVSLDERMANMILFPLFKDVADATGECYSTENQRKLIALLLLAEIRSKITAGTIDLTAPASYIPDIFADKELHRHVRDFLLKKDASFTAPIADKIAQMQISSSVIPTISEDKGAEILTAYHLADSLTYLLLDLQKYVSSSEQLKECQCCGRLFNYKSRPSEKYCRLPRKDTPLLCNEIMHISPKDEFAKAREGARKYQHSRTTNESTKKKYDEKFLSILYDNWSRECGEKCIEFKRMDDLQGFKVWIENTKFLAKELKRLWGEYQANGSIPYGGSEDN